MSYQKDYTAYPPEIREAIERVFDTGKKVMFECPSPSRARSVRGQFYAFIRALQHATAHKRMDEFETKAVDDLLRMGGQITIGTEGSFVVVWLKSARDEMTALRAALEGNTVPVEVVAPKEKEKA